MRKRSKTVSAFMGMLMAILVFCGMMPVNVMAADAQNAKSYTVTFDAMGGEPEPDAQKVLRSDCIVTPEKPTRTNCVLTGWYTDAACVRCGDNYTDAETSAAGHTFGEWKTVKESSCTEKGSRYRECEVCGYTETEDLEEDDHSFSTEYTVDKDATCTSDGGQSYHYVNEGCTATTGSVVIPAAGHKYSDWEITEEGSCTEGAKAKRVCSVCNSQLPTT